MPDQPKGPAPEKGDLSPEEIAAFERRVSDLGEKIGRVQAGKQAEITAEQDRAMQSKGMAMGLRMSSELVAAILVGGFIGYLLDKAFGTSPWLFLVFFFLGFAAGIMNVTRAFNQMQADIKRETGGNIGRSVADDDD